MNKVCPDCGSPLKFKEGVSKAGKPYSMMGCTGYPNCKYVENAPTTLELLQQILEVMQNIDKNIVNNQIK